MSCWIQTQVVDSWLSWLTSKYLGTGPMVIPWNPYFCHSVRRAAGSCGAPCCPFLQPSFFVDPERWWSWWSYCYKKVLPVFWVLELNDVDSHVRWNDVCTYVDATLLLRFRWCVPGRGCYVCNVGILWCSDMLCCKIMKNPSLSSLVFRAGNLNVQGASQPCLKTLEGNNPLSSHYSPINIPEACPLTLLTPVILSPLLRSEKAFS